MKQQSIQALYDKLLEGFAELNLLQRVVNQAFEREFETLDRYSESELSEKIVSRDAFGFDNPFTGKLEKYAFKTTMINDLKKITFWHKNNQYCWLLMSAYEKFEIFLNASYFELSGKRSRNLNPMLCYFSDNFPDFKKKESDNAFGVHLRIAVNLVEKMRHAIAHDQGIVPDIDKYVKKIIADSGINHNKPHHQEFVSQFIVENKVFILEVPANNDPILKLHHDQYRILVSYLIAYAYLVLDASK